MRLSQDQQAPGTGWEGSADARKVRFEANKNRWHPSLLPGQIVLVSTVNAEGVPNLAPKSWITMAAFAGPMIAFGCNVEHTTYQNILSTGEFVINIPGEPLTERIWPLMRYHGIERVRHCGFTFSPAQKVKPPLIKECAAHLECEFDSHRLYDNEVVIFGKIVAGSIDAACQVGTPPEQYFALRPIFFLENRMYGSIDTGKYIGHHYPTEQTLYVVQVGVVSDSKQDQCLVREHITFLQGLRARGQLLMAGPFPDQSNEEYSASPAAVGLNSGMYIISVASLEQAEGVARQDPLIRAGASCTVRAWTRTF